MESVWGTCYVKVRFDPFHVDGFDRFGTIRFVLLAKEASFVLLGVALFCGLCPPSLMQTAAGMS